jgi:hypothetical protein
VLVDPGLQAVVVRLPRHDVHRPGLLGRVGRPVGAAAGSVGDLPQGLEASGDPLGVSHGSGGSGGD